MARPSTGVASHGQAPCWGGQPRPGHLQGGDRLWPRPLTKGRPTTAKVPGTGGCRPRLGPSLEGVVAPAVRATAGGQGQPSSPVACVGAAAMT
ncbi:hypothetical protein BHE74_00057352 [Ensete ventricosum]|nr:hypothetical protein BHE74_00057352 [Ensete ventricosum]RZS08393.1 hypothetical protein BHM03_00039342 [Ensete ventricosum]